MASNQLPVAEKAKIISENFGIPFERVREIQKKEVKDCTFEELQIRYNDKELGQLPDWFDIEEAQTLVRKAVNSKWQDVLYPVYDKDDMFSECWTKILLATRRIKEVGEENYKGFIYRIATNHVTYTTYYHVEHLKHFKHDVGDLTELPMRNDSLNIRRLPEVIVNLNEIDKEIQDEDKVIYIADGGRQEAPEDKILDSIEEEMDMLNTIKSINDETVRDLLSIAAYLLVQLDSFRGLYEDAMCRMAENKRKELLDALKEENNKCLDFKRILKIVVGRESNTYLSLMKDYLRALMTNSRRLAEI